MKIWLPVEFEMELSDILRARLLSSPLPAMADAVRDTSLALASMSLRYSVII